MAILVDTSALYAMADKSTVEHAAVRAFVTQTRDVLLVPITVLPEVDYLFSTRLDQRLSASLLRSIVTGELGLENVTRMDLERCAELLEQYADSKLGLVDASIIAVAERLRITQVLTFDQRHFRFVRPRHCTAFEVMP